MTPLSSRPGYVFLVSAVVIGSIAVLGTLTLLLLGWVSAQNGQTHVRTNQALEYAQTCADRTMNKLRGISGEFNEGQYDGNEESTFDDGTCYVYGIENTGNARTLCIEGRSGNAVRRLEIQISALFPATRIAAWNDVSCCKSVAGQCGG